MNKLIIGASVTVLMVFLFASAFAFSASLANLRIGAASFTKPSAPVFAAPMTYADESNISAPQADTVRFQPIDNQEHVCQRDRIQSNTVGF